MSQRTEESSPEIIIDLNEKPMRVLHVDDELSFLEIAKQCLELQGPFQVDTVSSVEEAFEKLKKETYDAIVSDYQMPRKDGLEFLKDLRANGNSVPFVMFTGKGREEIAVKAWNLGADHYVNKDGDPETVYCELAHCLRSVVEKHAAETQARETTKKLQTIYQNALEGIAYVDPEENFVYVNKAFADILGCQEDQLVGMNLRRFVDEKDWGKMKRETEKRQRGEASRYELVLRRTDGTRRNVMISGSPSFGSDGSFAGTVGIVLDITERTEAEEKLRESREKYRDLAESIDDVFFAMDQELRYTYWNKASKRLTGISEKEAIGKSLTEVFPDVKGTKVEQFYLERLNTREPGTFLYEHNIKGKDFTFEINAYPTKNGLSVIAKDITERKRAEEVLQESEESFGALLEEAPIVICNTDLKGNITYVNKRFEEAMGYSREEVIGKNGFKLGIMSDKTSRLLAERMKDRLIGKPRRISEGLFKRKDGEWMWTEVEGKLIRRFGVPVGFQLIMIDISERKRAEKERRHYEEKLSALNTYSRNLNMATSMEAIYELTLEVAEKVLGFEFADILITEGKMLCLATLRGRSRVSSLTLPLDGDRGITVKAAKTGKPVFVPDVSKEKAYVEGGLETRSELAVPIMIGDRVLGVLNVESKELNAFNEKDRELLETLASHAATAISNLDRAKDLETYTREIQETKQKFEGLFLGNPEATVYLAPDFRIIDVNPRFEELFGNSLSEIKGICIDDVIVPKNMIDEAEMLDKKAIKGYVYHDTLRMRKDGSMVPVSVSAASILIQGKLVGYIGVYKDISALKKTEHTLAIMNEKLRVVGGLTRHDAQNKLLSVTGNAYLLKKQLADDSTALDKLRSIEAAVEQTVRIFDFAKTYEMLGAEELAYVDAEKTVNEAISLFSGLKGVKVTNDCHKLYVLADSLLRQLFFNLIDNSLKYGQKTTTIRLSFEKTGQQQLRLVYEDDGVGIPLANKPKLFKEGFTTGGSTGHGLYLIKKMMEVYGWTIEETGKEGRGARFVLTIPHLNSNGKENYQLR